MIEFVKGNFFDFDANIRVNTVNCVGVMGAGVALQFKTKYPEMNKEYVRLCSLGVIRPGKPHVWNNIKLFSEEKDLTIINFPTKDDWKNPSEYSYIEDGLIWLRKYLENKPNSVITIPALGCGHGGLDWINVKELIVRYLSGLNSRILVFEPSSSFENKSNISHLDLIRIKEKNIQLIEPSSSNYPANLRGKSTYEFYIKGDVKLLDDKIISIIIDNKAGEREYNAFLDCIDQFVDKNYSFLMGLNSKIEQDLLKEFIKRKIKVVVVVPEGVFKLKIRKDVKEVWDNNFVTLISLFPPNEEWKSYNNFKVTNFIINMTNILLLNTMRVEMLEKYEKLLNNNINVYYLNYWSNKVDFFEKINAKPISRSRSTNEPKLFQMIELVK